MAQDLNSLLQRLRELTQAAQEGRVTREQLDVEVRKLTGELQMALVNLSSQLQPGTPPEASYLVEVFQAQVAQVLSTLDQTGAEFEQSEDSENLSEDLKLRKRGGSIRT